MRETRDPIEHVREMMVMGDMVDEEQMKAIDKEIRAIVAEAAQFAQDSPEPAEAELWTDICA
jgi:pyruvate dehydrogenase E1 component alpha subunit